MANKYTYTAVRQVEMIRYGKPTMISSCHIALTELGERVLKRQYPNTSNEQLAGKMGLSMSTLARLARARGYKKSKSYRAALGKKASLESEKWYNSLTSEERRDYNERRSRQVAEAGAKYRFGTEAGERNRKKAVKSRPLWEGKRRDGYLRSRAKERARMVFGFEQKKRFRFRFTDDPIKYRNVANMRLRLRKSGCAISRGGFAVYNHEKVGTRLRENAKKNGFIFKDQNDGKEETH